MEKCTVGQYAKEDCHKLTYVKSTGLKYIHNLESELRATIYWRSGLTMINVNATICYHHEYSLTMRYVQREKKCCDPFRKHKKNVTGNIREISLASAKQLCSRNFTVIPGMKWCDNCRNKFSQKLHEPEKSADSRTGQCTAEEEGNDLEQEWVCNESRSSLSSTLQYLELSSLKLHSVPSHLRTRHGKRKIKQVETVVKKKLATILQLDPEQLSSGSTDDEMPNLQDQRKAADLDDLISEMKRKLAVSNRREKVQVLTLTPKSWSVRTAAKEFGVSRKTISKAISLREESGILAMPKKTKGREIINDLKDIVHQFYNSDEYSRQMPGKKDYVSIGSKVHVSKRLMLCNLKELHAHFKVKYPEAKIGFSTFAALRPKWCIIAGMSGTHSVCVCTHHQNVKLMLDSVSLDKSYHELIDMMVCSKDNNLCMLHRCESCPGISAIEEYLKKHFQIDTDDDEQNCSEDAEQIMFRQWVSVDRSELITQVLTTRDFIALLCDKLDNLTEHSYIAKSQSRYLSDLKDSLPENEVIILGDFAENYKFTVQDEVQGYHWNSQSCTLHPVVVYEKFHGKLQSHSLCVLSDDLEHDQILVWKVLEETVTFLRTFSSDVNKIHYFSDGCAAQYKNCKHFVNLCHHIHDFGIACQWNFFATSHGKSVCDGIGGTVKRITGKASLQRPSNNQILTANDMLAFCQQEIKGITFRFVSSETMSVYRERLAPRFSVAQTVPGTRSFHQITPIQPLTVAAKRVSEDTSYALEFNFGNASGSHLLLSEIKPAMFVVCKYDAQKWVGMVSEVDLANEDVLVQFMHPPFPCNSFTWPRRPDNCFVPVTNVLIAVEAPAISTARGRQYVLSEGDIDRIKNI